MKKKQQITFQGTTSEGRPMFSGSLEYLLVNSKSDPVPLNRKTRRAFKKLIGRVLSQPDKVVDPKRKQKRKAAKVARRINRD